MKLNKLYIDVFSDTMEAAGFKRRGVLFSRVKGDIMQGVILKMVNPFCVCVNICPVWTFTLMGFGKDELERGTWVESGLSIPGIYYQAKNVDKNKQAMRGCLEIVMESLIPKLDNIADEDAYIEAVYGHMLELPADELADKWRQVAAYGGGIDIFVGMITGKLSENPYALLHKAVREGSYTGIVAMLPDAMQHREAELRRMNRNGCIALNPDVLNAYRMDAAFRNQLDTMIQSHVKMMSEMIPDIQEEKLLMEAKRIYTPWEVKEMPTEDEWIRDELEKYKVNFFGGQEWYDAVHSGNLDAPRILYEKYAAEIDSIMMILGS